MRYLIYLRVSTQEQDLETQLNECLEFIRSRDKEEFEYEVYTDKISSLLELKDRPGIQRLLNDAQHGDILVARAVDRLARKAKDAYSIQEVLEEKKVGMVMVKQPHCDDPLLLAIYVGIAVKEIAYMRQRIKSALKTKRARNERTHYQVPYGYQIHPTKKVMARDGRKRIEKLGYVIEHPQEQQVLERMCALFDSGLSYRAIQEHLERDGVKNRKGNPFQLRSVYRILKQQGRTRSKQEVPRQTKMALFQ